MRYIICAQSEDGQIYWDGFGRYCLGSFWTDNRKDAKVFEGSQKAVNELVEEIHNQELDYALARKQGRNVFRIKAVLK